MAGRLRRRLGRTKELQQLLLQLLDEQWVVLLRPAGSSSGGGGSGSGGSGSSSSGSSNGHGSSNNQGNTGSMHMLGTLASMNVLWNCSDAAGAET